MEDYFSCSLFCCVLIEIMCLQDNNRNSTKQCWGSELKKKACDLECWADYWATTISYLVKKIILIVMPLRCSGGCPISAVDLLKVHLCHNDFRQQNYETLNQPTYQFLRLKFDSDFVLEIHFHLLFYHRIWIVRNFMIIAFPFSKDCFPCCFLFWEEAYCIPEFRFICPKPEKPKTPEVPEAWKIKPGCGNAHVQC